MYCINLTYLAAKQNPKTFVDHICAGEAVQAVEFSKVLNFSILDGCLQMTCAALSNFYNTAPNEQIRGWIQTYYGYFACLSEKKIVCKDTTNTKAYLHRMAHIFSQADKHLITESKVHVNTIPIDIFFESLRGVSEDKDKGKIVFFLGKKDDLGSAFADILKDVKVSIDNDWEDISLRYFDSRKRHVEVLTAINNLTLGTTYLLNCTSFRSQKFCYYDQYELQKYIDIAESTVKRIKYLR